MDSLSGAGSSLKTNSPLAATHSPITNNSSARGGTSQTPSLPTWGFCRARSCCRSCAYYRRHEFIWAMALPCLSNILWLQVTTTSVSHNLSASSLAMNPEPCRECECTISGSSYNQGCLGPWWSDAKAHHKLCCHMVLWRQSGSRGGGMLCKVQSCTLRIYIKLRKSSHLMTPGDILLRLPDSLVNRLRRVRVSHPRDWVYIKGVGGHRPYSLFLSTSSV